MNPGPAVRGSQHPPPTRPLHTQVGACHPPGAALLGMSGSSGLSPGHAFPPRGAPSCFSPGVLPQPFCLAHTTSTGGLALPSQPWAVASVAQGPGCWRASFLDG